MTSKGAGTSFSRKNYRLSTEPEKSKTVGKSTMSVLGGGDGIVGKS